MSTLFYVQIKRNLFLQLFPEFEDISLHNLRNALTYYENLKEKEEIKIAAANSDNNSDLSQNLSIVQ